MKIPYYTMKYMHEEIRDEINNKFLCDVYLLKLIYISKYKNLNKIAKILEKNGNN